MNQPIEIEVFTDPMMGLSYEHEPVLEKLREHYGERLTIRYIMAGLVRDVSEFMNACELSLNAEEGIAVYNKRLAKIYKSEESISGLPINMENFRLFDTEHRSSYPLCIAYGAAKLSDPAKADNYLYTLRKATIIEERQTVRTEELIACAAEAGINEKVFKTHFSDGSAEALFRTESQYARNLGIYNLPAYLIRVCHRQTLIRGLPDFEWFVSEITSMEKSY